MKAAHLEVTIVAADLKRVGGMERQLHALIGGLLDAGADVTLISRTCEFDGDGLRWVRVPAPRRPWALAYPIFLLGATIAICRHGHGIIHTTGALTLGKADVVTVHYCHAAAQAARRCSRSRYTAWWGRLASRIAEVEALLLERRVYCPRRARQLVAVSPGLAGELMEHYRAMKPRLKVIPNGVDRSLFKPDPVRRSKVREALAIDDQMLLAIFVGGEWGRKGLRAAISALADAPQWSLLVVGRGDTSTFGQTATACGVLDRVHFIGETTEPQSYYSAADAFVMPTAYETFSLATYEAAASGLPIIATPVSGVVDLVTPASGRLVDGSAQEIAQALRDLEDPAVRRSMGLAARAATREHSWERVVQQYLETYLELAA